ncbi:MAG TPA: FG-GAP and VCBS repeat-containing protein, partial [Blastocatellia bacterium]|nr:FG-GAP and VCBS repeat-containing protein [Blastocatellia bacterium]
NGDGVRDLVLVRNANFIFFGVPILFGPFTPGETIDLSTRQPDVIIKADDESFNIVGPYLADVNGDRLTDVLVRRPTIPGGVPPAFELAVIFGSENLRSRPEISFADADAVLDAGFGPFAIATGDVNGDGADDVLVGASGTVYEPGPLPWTPGSVSVTLGSSRLTGRMSLYNSYIEGPPQPNPFNRVFGVNLGGRLGTAVAVSDVDGDGITDMIIGAPGLTGSESGTLEPLSRVHVVLGSKEFQTRVSASIGREEQDITVSFSRGAESFGLGSRVGSGDFNGDGFGDILVGNSGVAYIFFGGLVRAPEITKAKYRTSSSELLVFGSDLTGSARVEVNGVLIEREVTFDPIEGRLFLQGPPTELNLKTGKNKVVVVRKGTRSNKIKFKL